MKHARQMSVWGTVLVLAFMAAVGSPAAYGATEQDKQQAIDDGLAWLASTQSTSGAEGYWPRGDSGTLATTASAVLAFIEEGYLPGDGSAYGDGVVQRACNYIFNRATNDTQGMYFNPGAYNRSVYTTGIVAPVVYALGKANPDAVVGMGSGAVAGQTYRQTMQDVSDWFGWGQNNDGGWQYQPNSGSSDNSTAQWGGLTLLYADAWGCTIRDPSNPGWDVKANLNNWVNYIQNATSGGSGYNTPNTYVNVAKTGGLLVELAAIGAPPGDPRVQAALNFINQRWNTLPSGDWYGNLNHPYAMWAVFKALETYSVSTMSNAPGGITIGQDWDPQTSLPGDWFAHYCDYLVNIQNGDGSWNGYSYWTGALATGWYINILNAAGAPPPIIPEPVTAMGLLLGVGCLARYVRRRKSR